jgi:hypothetical protein
MHLFDDPAEMPGAFESMPSTIQGQIPLALLVTFTRPVVLTDTERS